MPCSSLNDLSYRVEGQFVASYMRVQQENEGADKRVCFPSTPNQHRLLFLHFSSTYYVLLDVDTSRRWSIESTDVRDQRQEEGEGQTENRVQ